MCVANFLDIFTSIIPYGTFKKKSYRKYIGLWLNELLVEEIFKLFYNVF